MINLFLTKKIIRTLLGGNSNVTLLSKILQHINTKVAKNKLQVNTTQGQEKIIQSYINYRERLTDAR